MKTVTELAMRRLPRRACLYRAGEKADHAYVVHKGAILLHRDDESGRRTGFALVQPGETFGEEMLLKSLPRQHSAIAIMETYVECIDLNNDTREQLLHDTFKRRNRLEEILEARTAQHRMTRVRMYYAALNLGPKMIAELAAISREMFRAYCSKTNPDKGLEGSMKDMQSRPADPRNRTHYGLLRCGGPSFFISSVLYTKFRTNLSPSLLGLLSTVRYF